MFRQEPGHRAADRGCSERREGGALITGRDRVEPSANSRWVSLSLGACERGQEEGDPVGQVRATQPHLSVLEKAQVLPNKASRFSQVYPAGPLFLPSAHLLRTVPRLLPKKKKKKVSWSNS